MKLNGYDVTLPRHINGLAKFPLVQSQQDTRPAGEPGMTSQTYELLALAGVAALVWYGARAVSR